jgi:hypothetical protein
MKNIYLNLTKGIDRNKGALFMDSIENKLVVNFYNKSELNINFIDCEYYNLYITNDEKPKEGDWVINLKSNSVYSIFILNEVVDYEKKIIITTDQDLIADGVQGIEDSFLEWFINNPTCDFIETERIEDGQYVDRFADGSVIEGIYENYKIIIPQEKIKQTDEKGNPLTFWGGLKKHKKESIEEEAELFAKSRVELDPIYANGLYYGFIQCGMSKWFEAEKIKAQIEENLSVLEMLEIHGTESSIFRVKMRIKQLEKELKTDDNGLD